MTMRWGLVFMVIAPTLSCAATNDAFYGQYASSIDVEASGDIGMYTSTVTVRSDRSADLAIEFSGGGLAGSASDCVLLASRNDMTATIRPGQQCAIGLDHITVIDGTASVDTDFNLQVTIHGMSNQGTPHTVTVTILGVG